MALTLPPETGLFRCVAVIELPFPGREVIPGRYLNSLTQGRRVKLGSGFQSRIQPLFVPTGKAPAGASVKRFSVWELKYEISFSTAFTSWPESRGETPFCFLEDLFAAQTEMIGPFLRPDGRCILAMMGGAPQTPDPSAPLGYRIGTPEQHAVRFRYDLFGARQYWDIEQEARISTSDICPPDVLFLVGH